MSEKVWVNGRLVDAAKASVSAFDSGLLHGIGLFETMRAAGGTVFRLDAHLDRMMASAEALAIRIRGDRAQLRRAVTETIEANGLADARVRLTVTPGPLQDPGLNGEMGGTVIVTAVPFVPYPEENYRKGMTVIITPYRQQAADPTAGHKTTNYFARLAALRQGQQLRAGEAMWFTPEHQLAEGSVSNVFLVQDEKLLTPPIDTPVLPGITRAVVLELAAATGVDAEETTLTVDDLLDADEVFLTNSIMGIMPVCRVERHAIDDEKPGVLTAKLAVELGRLFERECGDGD